MLKMLKNKLWLFQVPFVILFTGAYIVTDAGLKGELQNRFLFEKVYPKLQKVVTLFSDARFAIRGPIPPKDKVVIVEIDSGAIDQYGRWPWHRDVIAELIDRTLEAGAKVVGMDVVFSEPDTRVSPQMKQFLTERKLAEHIDSFETDHALKHIVAKRADRLVLGLASESLCRADQTPRSQFAPPAAAPVAAAEPAPAAEALSEYNCPVAPDGTEVAQMFPAGFERFALQGIEMPKHFDIWKTPIWTALTFLTNLEEYNNVAKHSAYFNVFPDQDHVIRRLPLVVMYNGRPYPSLSLEMARIGLDEKIEMDFDQESRLKQLRFAKSGFEIPVNSAATMEINFRGGSHSFPYVSAMEMMNDEPTLQDEGNGRKLASVAKTDVLKDAYVFIGVTALGTNDMRAFPMDPNVPGVEGHANILDNLLGKDMLIPSYRTHSTLLLMLMIFGALAFSFAVQRLDAIPALLVFVAAFGGFGFADFKILFGQNISANSSFFYLEILSIFFVTVAVKYVIEERSKKFVRGAFAKYVAPAVVDSILKNPEKLQVGGEKRDLTIMFSDIRSFTTFSERLDAKALAAFLNDYLGIMTKIVFAHEGTLDKYIGDAIMAFWGAPLDQPLHAANACKASMAMMKALHENKDRWKKEFNVDVSIGVGINSGPVNVGNMGSSDNFSYTVIGDHVNLSSRLEGLTKAYGVAILTTRFTFDDIGKSGGVIPPHRVLDNVKVKGKKNAVELIQVLDRELSKEGLEIFETARKLYEAQKWDEATALFKKAAPLLAFAPDQPDAPCDMYVERCEEFKKNPPGQDWDGSWEMHSK